MGPSLHCEANADEALLASSRKEALFALPLELLVLTNMIPARIPMIAMTIKSSIRVNAFFVFIKIFER